ncbi:hypothetical protein [Sphingomonas sp.]|uniref:hypothetical protein n=1 Tax=Sphingomonas sp. TaxID=28214 RepID=UPI0031DAE991
MSVVAEIVSSVLEAVWEETVGAIHRRFGLTAAILFAVVSLALVAGGIALLVRA